MKRSLTLPITLLATLLLALLTALASAADRDTEADLHLPALNWEQRSGWFNVKQHGAAGDGVAGDTVSLPGKIFDARKNFDAKGDGKSDDTQAVQATNDAAREHGNRALAYFPAGTYNLTRTIQAHGRNCAIGGAGLETTLRWRGRLGPAVMEVKDPQEITIEHLTVASDNDGARAKRGTTADGKKTSVAEFLRSRTPEDRIRENTGNMKIRQTGEAKQSSVHYNGLYLTSTYDAVPGIEFVNLPFGDEVRIGALYGCLHFSDSEQATALATVHYGRLVVDGAKLPKSGFIGMLFHNDVHRDFALTVKDNQNLMVAEALDDFREIGRINLRLNYPDNRKAPE